MKKFAIILIVILTSGLKLYSQTEYNTYVVSFWFARNTTYVSPLKLDGFSVTISGDKISLPDGVNSNKSVYYIRDYPGTFPPASEKVYLNGSIERWYNSSLQTRKTYTNESIDYLGTENDFFFPGYGCYLEMHYYGYTLKKPQLADGSYTGAHCKSDTIGIKYTSLTQYKNYNLYVGVKNADGTFTWNSSATKSITNGNADPATGIISFSYADFAGSTTSNMYGKKFYLAAKGGNLTPAAYPTAQPLGEETGPFIFYPPFPDPTVTPTSPTCKGYTDAAIRLDFSTDSVSRYDFSISKLVKKADPADDCNSTYGAGGVGTPSDNNYCFTGEGASISGTTSNSYIIINNDALGDDPSKNNGTGLKGYFGAGDYEITAELKSKYGLSCVFYKIVNIPEAPELVLDTAYAKNNYTWGDSIYQVRGYGASDTIVIKAGGGHVPYNYSVDNGTTYSASTNNTTYLYTGVTAGSYTVRITDAHLCAAQNNKTIPITVKQPATLSITGFVTDTVSCHTSNIGTHDDGTIQFGIKGGIGPYDISLQTASNIVSPQDDNNVVLDGLSSGNYKIIVKDKYISGWDSSINLTSYTQLGFNSMTASDKHWPNCIGGSDGYIKVSGYGGKPFSATNYKFGVINSSDTTWADADSITSLNALQPYTIVIKDQLGCEDTVMNIVVPQNPDPLRIILTDTISPTCYTYSDGKAIFTGTNGWPFSYGYVFTLKDITTQDETQQNAYTAQFGDLPKGMYQITIKDKYDCEINDYYRDTISLSEPLQITIATSSTQVSRKGLYNGRIQAVLSGGNQKYRYEWYSGLSALSDSLIKSGTTKDTAFIDQLGTGDYLLRVQDTCGCNNGQGEDAWLEWETHISEPTLALGFTVTEHKDITCNGMSDGRFIVEGYGGWGNNYRYGLV
jgi:hypothetical protein